MTRHILRWGWHLCVRASLPLLSAAAAVLGVRVPYLSRSMTVLDYIRSSAPAANVVAVSLLPRQGLSPGFKRSLNVSDEQVHDAVREVNRRLAR